MYRRLLKVFFGGKKFYILEFREFVKWENKSNQVERYNIVNRVKKCKIYKTYRPVNVK